MNTTMWEHPATQRNLQRLRADGVHIMEPDAGEMACGTIGPGRLSEPDRIVTAARNSPRAAIGPGKRLSGRAVSDYSGRNT